MLLPTSSITFGPGRSISSVTAAMKPRNRSGGGMAGILTETARRVIPEREDDGEAAGWARAGASGGVRRRG
ncbi:hypothetical protein Apmu_0516_01 [Acidiphilium multivorum AIU301]|nr:hypothetical protein Apmu_0516_01 [Acidiphilium multivorum AIU301]